MEDNVLLALIIWDTILSITLLPSAGVLLYELYKLKKVIEKLNNV